MGIKFVTDVPYAALSTMMSKVHAEKIQRVARVAFGDKAACRSRIAIYIEAQVDTRPSSKSSMGADDVQAAIEHMAPHAR